MTEHLKNPRFFNLRDLLTNSLIRVVTYWSNYQSSYYRRVTRKFLIQSETFKLAHSAAFFTMRICYWSNLVLQEIFRVSRWYFMGGGMFLVYTYCTIKYNTLLSLLWQQQQIMTAKYCLLRHWLSVSLYRVFFGSYGKDTNISYSQYFKHIFFLCIKVHKCYVLYHSVFLSCCLCWLFKWIYLTNIID